MTGVIGELGVRLGSICALSLLLLVTLVEPECHQAALSVLLRLGVSLELPLPPVKEGLVFSFFQGFEELLSFFLSSHLLFLSRT